MIKIAKPYKTAKLSDITQGFNEQHKAIDWASKYGEWLVAPFNAKVAVIRSPDKLDGTDFDLKAGCGIRLISIEDPTISFMHWHCLPVFPVEVGNTVMQGEEVAQMGNTGFVISNGIVVPYELRDTPNYPGTHDHSTMSIGEELVDYSKYIDWSIPVGTNILEKTMKVLQKISNLLLGK